jgi:pseudouridine synthase
MLVRLNKFLAHSGVCSRREADRLIEAGRIKVNGRVVMELGSKIDPALDRVQAGARGVGGGDAGPVFILLHKPAGHVVTVKDPFGRPTVMDLLPKLRARVYPVGRLDAASEGALLLTNDGELAFRLTHPKHGIDKVYEVRLNGAPSEADLEKIRNGLFLEGRKTAPAQVRLLRPGPRGALVRLAIHEGRKREIRKMFEALGHKVTGLLRVEFAGLTLDGLRPGQWRYLKKTEVARLKKLTGLSSAG